MPTSTLTTQSETIPSMSNELAAVKAKMKHTWESGNWDYFSRFMEDSSKEFLERLDPPAGIQMLDVACGSGGLCLMAARKGLEVTGADLAANNVIAAHGRAGSESLNIRFDEADAEKLPYEDNSFDLVTSIYGAMFAPRPQLVASELVRVARPGARIAMGNWTPQGFVGQMFKLVAGFVPPPPGVPSPLLWGTEDAVRERFGDRVKDLQMKRVSFRFDMRFSPAQVTEFFREYFGPMNRAHANLPADEWEKLSAAFTELWAAANQSGREDRTTVDSEYLHVEAIKA